MNEEPDYRDPAFWDGRYRDGRPNWDIGEPAPPLVSYFAERQTKGKLAILGCGQGNDALWLAEQGWDATGFDFSPVAIETAEERARRRNLSVRLLLRDLFTLRSEFPAMFDVVVEHTCFCAIDPKRRGEYAEVVSDILRPGGLFVGLFYRILDPDGPPFPTSAEELNALFAPYFEEITTFIPENSHPNRHLRELFSVRRKSGFDYERGNPELYSTHVFPPSSE